MNSALPVMPRRGAVRIGLAILFIFVGCSYSSELKHPLYPAYVHGIHTVLLLPPEVGAYREMDDGSMVWRDDYTQAARHELSKAVNRILTSKRLTVHNADTGILQDPETQSVQALYRAVDHSIRLHALGPQLFPAKLASFDYELGSVADLLKKSAADALVLAIGHQTVSSNQVRTWVSIALVESQGRIIWYNIAGVASPSLGIVPCRAVQDLAAQVLRPLAGAAS
jgi:hypothetical protein